MSCVEWMYETLFTVSGMKTFGYASKVRMGESNKSNLLVMSLVARLKDSLRLERTPHAVLTLTLSWFQLSVLSDIRSLR